VTFSAETTRPAKLRIGYWQRARSWVIGTLRSMGSQQIPEPFDRVGMSGQLVLTDDTVPAPSEDGQPCDDLQKDGCGTKRASGTATLAPLGGKRVDFSFSLSPDLAEGLVPRDCLIGDYNDAFRFPSARKIARSFEKSLSIENLRTRRFSIQARDSYSFTGERDGRPLESRTQRSLKLTFTRP
jgi:hypothetical protein